MTNKKRKRAPGGGRRPKGPISGNAGWLQARITEDLRTSLDRAAAQNGRSLSQEAQVRLKESFDLPAKLQKHWGPPHVRALAQLVSSVVLRVETVVSGDPFAEKVSECAWHRNSFTHAAVCEAVDLILAQWKPAGPLETPPEIRKRAELLGPEHAQAQSTPEGVGRSCALGLLDQLAFMQLPPWPSDTDGYGEGYYVLPNIRDVLNEESKK